MFRCMSCGQELGWIGDFNNDEIYGEDAPDGATGLYTCGDCELDYEISTFNDSDEIQVRFYETEQL